MRTHGVAAAVWLFCLFAPSAEALVIDNFSTDQSVVVLTPAVSAASQVAGGGILGGERDFEVGLASGTGVTGVVTGGRITYGHIAASQGTGTIVWDGPDGDSALDPTGLGGVDFTDGGLSDAIAMSLLFDDFAAPLVLTAYTNAANFSTYTLVLPGNIPPDPAQLLVVPFADFAVAGGSGVDFADVGAFSVFIDGNSTSALDLELDFIETMSMVAVPEPAPAQLVVIGLIGLAWLRRAQRISD